MKRFITTILLLVSFSLSSYAYGIQEWESFRKMDYAEQVEVVKKLQDLVVSIEETQRQILKYEVTSIKNPGQLNQLKERLAVMLSHLSNILVAPVSAEEDFSKLCLFAGWNAQYSKVKGDIYCNISAIKNTSNNYSTPYLTDLNKKSRPINNCHKSSQVPCHPMLFGTEKNGNMFCVDKSSGPNYKNASKKCREQSLKVNNYGIIIANILKNPKHFLEVVKSIDRLCLCDVDGVQNPNEYRSIIQKDSTCRSLTMQLHDLFSKGGQNNDKWFCANTLQDPAGYNLKDVRPLVDKLSKEQDYLAARNKFCTKPDPGTTCTPGDNDGDPDDDGNPDDDGGGGVCPNPNGDDGKPVLTLKMVWVEGADKKSGTFKVQSYTCKLDGKTESKDCKLSYVVGTTPAVEMALTAESAKFDKKDSKNPQTVVFTLVSTKNPNDKATDSQNVPALADAPAAKYAIKMKISEEDKDKISYKPESATCNGVAYAEADLAKIKDCKLNFSLEKKTAENMGLTDSKQFDKIADKEQKVVFTLLPNDELIKDSASEEKTIPKKGEMTPPTGGLAVTLGEPEELTVKVTALTCLDVTKPEELDKNTKCVLKWFVKQGEKPVKEEDKEDPVKDEDKDPDPANTTTAGDYGEEQDSSGISLTLASKDVDQIVTVELSNGVDKVYDTKTVKAAIKDEDKDKDKEDEDKDKDAEEDETTPAPVPPQMPPVIPIQPMILQGVP